MKEPRPAPIPAKPAVPTDVPSVARKGTEPEAAKAGSFKVIAVGNPNIKNHADDYLTDLTEFKF